MGRNIERIGTVSVSTQHLGTFDVLNPAASDSSLGVLCLFAFHRMVGVQQRSHTVLGRVLV